MLIDIRATKINDQRHIKELCRTLDNLGSGHLGRKVTSDIIYDLRQTLCAIDSRWINSHDQTVNISNDNEDRTLVGAVAELVASLNGTWHSKHKNIYQVHVSKVIGTVAIPHTRKKNSGIGLIMPVKELTNTLYYSPKNVVDMLVRQRSFEHRKEDYPADVLVSCKNILKIIKFKKDDLTVSLINKLILSIKALAYHLIYVNIDRLELDKLKVTAKQEKELTFTDHNTIACIMVSGYYHLAKNHDYKAVVTTPHW